MLIIHQKDIKVWSRKGNHNILEVTSKHWQSGVRIRYKPSTSSKHILLVSLPADLFNAWMDSIGNNNLPSLDSDPDYQIIERVMNGTSGFLLSSLSL